MEASIDGSHPVLQRILRLTDKLAASRVPVLIVGEDGCGRETLARVIHARGAAGPARFVVVHCGRVPRDASGLSDSLGRALAAPRGEAAGTLFLREVGELPPSVQRDLARALLDTSSAPPCWRVIASTVSEPLTEIGQGRLCDELCDALLRVTLYLPPLRERRSDVPSLVQRILEKRVARGEAPCRVTTEAMVYLWEHNWPGNVRELKDLIDRLAGASRDGLIHAADLPPAVRSSSCSDRRPPLASIARRLRFAS